MDRLMVFVAEGLLGYFLQCIGCILGICAVARKRVNWLPLLIASAVFAVIVYVIRTVGRFNFGVHTMLILLIVNLICILFLKIDIKHSVLGSLLFTIMVLAGEIISYSVLLTFMDQAQINIQMAQPLFKAWSAVPGNLLLGIIVTIAYVLRVVKGKKDDGKTG